MPRPLPSWNIYVVRSTLARPLFRVFAISDAPSPPALNRRNSFGSMFGFCPLSMPTAVLRRKEEHVIHLTLRADSRAIMRKLSRTAKASRSNDQR